ncbi:MAG TPA: hypothetical protein VGM85_01840 [Paraburkholderia sp.]|jgi:hypothetical protein
MISIRIACGAALAALVALAATLAPADAADRQPLVLDTQRGISDGQPGVVLQNAPLSRAPMVNAQSPARPVELAPDAAQPPIIVAPYVQLPGASGGTRPPSRQRPPSPKSFNQQ